VRFKEKIYYTKCECYCDEIILYYFTTLYFLQIRFLWRTEKKKLLKNVVNTVTSSDLSTDEALYAVVCLTLRLLMSYIYGAPSKARNANVVYI